MGTQFKLKRCYKKNGSYKFLARYMSKYMTKDFENEKSSIQRQLNFKLYRFSYNCSKPQSVSRVVSLDYGELTVLALNGST